MNSVYKGLRQQVVRMETDLLAQNQLLQQQIDSIRARPPKLRDR